MDVFPEYPHALGACGLRRLLVSGAVSYCRISRVLTDRVELRLEGDEARDLRADCAVRTPELIRMITYGMMLLEAVGNMCFDCASFYASVAC